MRIFRYLAFAIIMLAVASCGSKRSAVQSVEIAGEHLTLQQLYEKLADTYSPWQDLYMPVNISATAPAKFSISGRATMVRGESIYISLRMLGMEGGCVYVTTDSVFVVDKYHKYAYCERLEKLLKDYPMTVSDIQDMLLGQAFIPGKGTADKAYVKDLSFSPDSADVWTMEPKKAASGIEWWCTATETLPPILASISFAIQGMSQVDCIYNDAVETEGGVAQSIMDVYAKAGDKQVAAKIKWNLDKSTWNSGKRPAFQMPKGCRMIDTETLLQVLKKL